MTNSKPKRAKAAPGGADLPKATSGDVAQRSVAEICSRLDARRASLDWLPRISQLATVYLNSDPDRIGADFLRLAISEAKLAQKALELGLADAAALSAMAAIQAAWRAEIAEGRVMLDAGVKQYRRAEKARADRSAEASNERAAWQLQADAIWGRNPALSALAVAARIEPQRQNYIRKHIKKPER